MTDYGHPLQFGAFLTPAADDAEGVVALARLAEAAGLDLVTIQDHPYQPRFLDMWTLLSVIAAQTTTIRVAPNVANLPLRQPVVLARSVASLDLLSGGRVELGLGAGAMWDAIAAVGGPRRTPGESIRELEKAIDAIRGFWRRPAPAHPVELWLGVLKPRALALCGRKGDGWVPSSSYVPPAALADGNARIDAAAAGAGREPAAIRRLYNLMGRFGDGAGFLEGAPAAWAEQLAALALEHGTSVFILASDDAGDLQRFAEEVAPAVRERVEAARAGAPATPTGEAPRPRAAKAPFAVVPTAGGGALLSAERSREEAGRPAGPPRDPARRYSASQQARGQHLIDVHDALRAEVAQVRDLIGQVARGDVDAAAARTLINRMTIRQNHWTLGAYCESYCRMVTTHHTIEDRSVFPHLGRADPRLAPVLDRLQEEHEVIAALLDRVDDGLVDLVAAEPDALAEVGAAVDLLTDAMASHLAYEERELVEPLARHGFGA